jgi:hypothetical protein
MLYVEDITRDGRLVEKQKGQGRFNLNVRTVVVVIWSTQHYATRCWFLWTCLDARCESVPLLVDPINLDHFSHLHVVSHRLSTLSH